MRAKILVLISNCPHSNLILGSFKGFQNHKGNWENIGGYFRI